MQSFFNDYILDLFCWWCFTDKLPWDSLPFQLPPNWENMFASLFSKHHRLIANPSDLSNDQWKNPGWLGVVQGMTSYRSFIGILISRSKNKSKKPVCVPTPTAPPPKTGSRSPEVRLHHRHQRQRGDGGASPMVCVAMFLVWWCVWFLMVGEKSLISGLFWVSHWVCKPVVVVLGFPFSPNWSCKQSRFHTWNPNDPLFWLDGWSQRWRTNRFQLDSDCDAVIRLMEQILHHLGCVKPCNGINNLSTGAGFPFISSISFICSNYWFTSLDMILKGKQLDISSGRFATPLAARDNWSVTSSTRDPLALGQALAFNSTSAAAFNRAP